MSSLAVTCASLLILLPSIIFGVSASPILAQQHGYVDVTAEDGTAFATSTYNSDYKADKAFQIFGSMGSKDYWCSIRDAEKPVYLWFQYKEPKRVTIIRFFQKYKLRPGEVYEVFASDAVGNCSNENSQTILFRGTADVFSAGVAFENKLPFSCYGLKVQSQSEEGYVAVKMLMFGNNLKEYVPLTLDGAEYFATSEFDGYGYDYGPQWAFKRQTPNTRLWVSMGTFPQTVHVRLPSPDTVSGFSFRSSLINTYVYDYNESPTKFDFIGSNDCESWTVIAQVSGVRRWNKKDEKKSWSIPIKQRASYKCYGIRVHSVQSGNQMTVAIQDVKLWSDDCKSHECVHGTCKNGVYDYICDCKPGYEGEICDKDINDCMNHECVYGTCKDGVNNYTCNCQPGYEGVMCDKDIDDCMNHECVHGTCKDEVNNYTCDCPPRYEGEMCDKDYFDELMDKAPKNVINVAYEGNNVLDEKSQGKENTPTQVRYQPLSITMPKTKDGLFYTLIMIDPDTPSRDTPIKNKTQVLHWLMVNIPGHGFGGRHLAPYIGSGPPQETGIHRYTFLIFEEGKTPKDYKGIAPFDTVDVARRVYWNFVEHGKPWTLRGFMNWAKLGEPVAANFYQAQYANADVDVDDNL